MSGNRFVAVRSVLLDGRMYQAGEVIECALTRGKAKLLLAAKTIKAVATESPNRVDALVEDAAERHVPESVRRRRRK